MASEIKIKRFKDGSLNFWANYIHFSLVNGDITFCAGGIATEEHINKLKQYLKRNKISYNE